jgi:hypothetical protein
LRQPIAVTAWTRGECAGDNLRARAILAACGAGARSDEALEAVAATRAAIPTPALRLLSLRTLGDSLRPVTAYFGM